MSTLTDAMKSDIFWYKMGYFTYEQNNVPYDEHEKFFYEQIEKIGYSPESAGLLDRYNEKPRPNGLMLYWERVGVDIKHITPEDVMKIHNEVQNVHGIFTNEIRLWETRRCGWLKKGDILCKK